ncbi:tetratricopeptide repeat protein [Aeromonas veronii]|uniref:tetratricopeptide repeat protein n=1 Tax=Aeromonas veronii TaxID=654 RepID=UPI00191E5B64|nr:hypothetical protein [Aeromonas veronii]MBL0613146.1 hypothetical protein [Aeromonas veronii]
MTPEINRRKCAMVLHQIEISLGAYVIDRESSLDNIPQKTINDIAQRELQRNKHFKIETVRDLVESTYLDEIFQISLEITKDTIENKYLQHIKNLFQIYDIYQIRNVISHPNRKFIDGYWYKVAALASDPTIDILGLTEIKSVLMSAEKGEISEPPEEWYKKSLWSIPNNIPDNFEHAITGLVGRSSEADNLLGFMKNKRVPTIAIVAPGGLGKTALALDLISKQMYLPETHDWCDGCIFISLKNERLTANGIQTLQAAETIEEIIELIVSQANIIFHDNFIDFEDLKSQYASKQILLFIDNLETLLIEHQDSFHLFNINLPPAWRVIVTSRIAINNASIISLHPLKDSSATHMAKIYSSRRGGINQDERVYKNIAKNCHYNPLAIRLTIDLFISGHEVPSSINIANREIASFSYNNLIDSLSDTAVKILEALFVDDNCTRTDLCEILDINPDEIALGISELSNTSLITRKNTDDKEMFILSSSIRDLLITNTKNIEVRSKIQESLRSRKLRALEIDAKQERAKIKRWDWNYIPPEINEGLKILLTELNKNIKKLYKIKPDSAIAIFNKFKSAENVYDGVALFNRGYALLLNTLNASDEAIKRLDKAILIDQLDPNSLLLKAFIHHNRSEFDDAISAYEKLYMMNWHIPETGDQELSFQVVFGYFQSKIYGHKFTEILDETKEWKKDIHFRGLIGSFRALALKRSAEDIVNTDIDKAADILIRSIRTLNDVFINDGYIKTACVHARNIFNELSYCLVRDEYKKKALFANEALNFIATHLKETVKVTSYNETDQAIRLVKKLAEVDVPNNPFKNKGNDILQYKSEEEHDDTPDLETLELLSKGYVEAYISGIPKAKNGEFTRYIFAETDNKENYFIHFDQVKSTNWTQWARIKPGEKIILLPSARKSNGKARNVEEAHLA